MKLKELAWSIEAWSRPSDCALNESDVYSLLTRPLAQLRMAANVALDEGTKTNGYWIRRVAALDPSTDIEGEYLLVDYSPHDPALTMWTFGKSKEIEDYLVSLSGPLNPFCEYAIPFFKGDALDYSLHFEANGRAEEFQFENRFRRTYDFGMKPMNCRIEWKGLTRR